MSMRIRLRCIMVFACWAWLVVAIDAADASAARRAETPNVVVVLIDDMGFSDLSCFGGGRVQTPNIDSLATEGVRFTRFYVNSPICSPSRVALSTGQYPQRHRISSFLANRQSNRKRGMAQWLSTDAPMLPRQLADAGYATGHFGKWHMGGQRDVGDAPLITEYGFERSLTNFEGLGDRVLGFKNKFDGSAAPLHSLGSDQLGRGNIETIDRSRVTERYVAAAIDFIDDATASDRPFYVNVWPDDVHSPFFPPKTLREASDQSKSGLYDAVLRAMDEQLGPLFDRIRNDEALAKQTLILFLSDNGPEPGAGTSEPLRGYKTWLYEGGIRSPLIVWGPGFIARSSVGTVNDESFLTSIDLNRSLYDITSAELPNGVTLDGESVAATLLGKSKRSRSTPAYFRRPPDRPGPGWGLQEDAPDLAAIEADWKLVMNQGREDTRLYDLSRDSREQKDVSAEYPRVAQRLADGLQAWSDTLPPDAGVPEYAVKER